MIEDIRKTALAHAMELSRSRINPEASGIVEDASVFEGYLAGSSKAAVSNSHADAFPIGTEHPSIGLEFLEKFRRSRVEKILSLPFVESPLLYPLTKQARLRVLERAILLVQSAISQARPEDLEKEFLRRKILSHRPSSQQSSASSSSKDGESMGDITDPPHAETVALDTLPGTQPCMPHRMDGEATR
ncbi:hypothetical protein [Acetobacter oryzoeni]|uniref:Uncharacterized protein n=1 Tax=Acetobacter oryzoeni TaxID=2500548 RepID=A0A5B9GKF5_9PROT|nr:hypothetical protein [Acetobacter oryzoeni]MCP1202284.1 hypothetical protein [Acetobacter oryzoeni]QEE86009.1 hypothetical protein EOV40_010020 [Acetobacter oryzoeni]